MNRNAVLRTVAVAVAWGVVAGVPALADDGAASIAAGGLVPRRETRIVMAKEVLQISQKKIVVEYDFRNDTAEDVSTEVAFPIPPYTSGFVEGPSPEEQSFQSFKLWVNGKPVHYESVAKATLNDKDVTAHLEANHIDIPTFGHFKVSLDSKRVEVIETPDFTRLSQSARDQLVKEGLFELVDDPWGKWTVHLQYHWTQTFPAHSTTHIRHEYAPVVGAADNMSVDALRVMLIPGSAQKDAKRWSDSEAETIAGYCPEPELVRGMIRGTSEVKNDIYDGTSFPLQWVDFILTSANTWQKPIEDFTLIVERPQPDGGWRSQVSFCAPAKGKVEQLDADHLQVHLTNFVPTSELHIGYFMLLQGKAASPVAKNCTPASNSTRAAHRRVSLITMGLIAGVILLLILAALRIRQKREKV